jgi:hypothetical protein
MSFWEGSVNLVLKVDAIPMPSPSTIYHVQLGQKEKKL